MIIYNYSGLQQRDTKIYNLGGYNITGGLSIDFLKVVAPVFFVFMVLGFIISLPFGIDFLNPFGENFKLAYTLTFLIVGIVIGLGMYYIQFAGFRLYQYLIAYIKPKKIYQNDKRTSTVKLTNIKVDGFIRSIV